MGGDFKLLIFKRISRDCKVKKLIFSTRHTRCLNESWSPSDFNCLCIDDTDKHFTILVSWIWIKNVEEPPCKFETQWAKLRVGQSKIIRLTISDKRRPSILTTDWPLDNTQIMPSFKDFSNYIGIIDSKVLKIRPKTWSSSVILEQYTPLICSVLLTFCSISIFFSTIYGWFRNGPFVLFPFWASYSLFHLLGHHNCSSSNFQL